MIAEGAAPNAAAKALSPPNVSAGQRNPNSEDPPEAFTAVREESLISRGSTETGAPFSVALYQTGMYSSPQNRQKYVVKRRFSDEPGAKR